MINFNHLYYFYVVAREGTVTSAAKKLRISQPALSTQIKNLEDHLRTPLFVRSGRRIEMTEHGRLVYGVARQMFELADELLNELRHSARTINQRLHLGVADDVERPFSVHLVTRLLETGEAEMSPYVTLVCGSHDELLQKLRVQKVDAVLSDRPAATRTIEVLGTSQVPVVFAARSNPRPWRSAIQTPAEMKTLLESGHIKLVLPSTKLRLRKEIDEYLKKNAIEPHIAFEGDLLASVVRAVEDGIGASFLPSPFIAEGVTAGRLVTCGPPQGFWKFSLWLLTDKRTVETNSLIPRLKQAFLSLAQSFEGPTPPKSLAA
jgi:LysR family transcriptional regulator, transcriptional activator of nhaA